MAAIGAPWPAAVGVSGGSDSLALMFLLRDWARRRRLAAPVVLCVDHRMRPESAREAHQVAAWSRKAGLVAHVLHAADAITAQSDIEAACRTLRFRLFGEWAAKRKLHAVYLAHTLDDQAETFLIRLARGSGVDGLAAMRSVTCFPVPAFAHLKVVRPLLGFRRGELRGYLKDAGRTWFEDPMNGDVRFLRARIRQAWPQLEALGLTRLRLAETAGHLGRARAALDSASQAVAARAFRPLPDGVAADPRALAAAPRELALRALAGILMLVGQRAYRPRFESLAALFDSLIGSGIGNGKTLHGCRIAPATPKCAPFGACTLLIRPEKPSNTLGKG